MSINKEAYQTAFDKFKQRFLKDKKSIFRLDCDDEILNENSIKYLKNNFLNNGYIGDGGKKENQTNSIEKFHHQLTGKHLNEKVDSLSQEVKNAIEVLATAVWLWRLPASNTNGNRRKRSVQEILNFNPEWKCTQGEKEKPNDDCLENADFFGNYNGFAMPGIGYNTNKANELAYIIDFFEKCMDDNFDQIKHLIKEDTVTINTAYSYIKDNDGYKRASIISPEKSEKVSIYNPLLHLIDPDEYEPIISNNHKTKIVDVFSVLFQDRIELDDKQEKDVKIKIIKNELQKIDKNYDFYHDSVKSIWLGGLDFDSKNIILHGAPGTGKTYMTETTVKARKLIENNSEYELVQFHPSYGYEDFIEGIKPTELNEDSGQMKFELKNGLFKQMCVDAFEELKKKPDNPKKFYFVADEINRAELSRVFGELLLCLEEDKRLKIKGKKVIGAKVQTPNSILWAKDEHIVVKVNENDEIDEKGKAYFGVPENVYFIGTMNDIDRSVDSFDMALRRRFVWKHYKCDYDVVATHYEGSDYDTLANYIKICKDLNKHIVDEKGFNLSDSYELGHSYFMKPKSIAQTQLDRVWQENIAPLLKEYLRAEYDEKEILKQLKEAKKRFTL